MVLKVIVAAVLVVVSCLLALFATGHRRRAGRTRVRRLFGRVRGVAGESRDGLAHRAAPAHVGVTVPAHRDSRARSALATRWLSTGSAWWATTFGAGLGLVVGYLAVGIVGAAVLAAYGAAGVVLLHRRMVRRSRARAQRLAADAIAALAADLSAGVAENEALLETESALRAAADRVAPSRPLVHARRVASAVAVSRASGAPLADVLHRLDTHLRSTDRARAFAETQAAGARASAVLLAVMPLAGVGLGTAIGVDPLHVLLHTTIGGAALCLSVALQLGGLAWTARLATVDVRS